MGWFKRQAKRYWKYAAGAAGAIVGGLVGGPVGAAIGVGLAAAGGEVAKGAVVGREILDVTKKK